MATAVTISTVDPGDDVTVRTAFNDVLRPSFSTAELPSVDALVVGVSEPGLGYHLVVARDGDGRVVGAAVHEDGDPDLGMLDYLAVRPDVRSGGIGAALMGELRRRWAEGGRPVLGEVHDPRRWEETPDERPTARLRFYQRQEARLALVPWMQPALGRSGARVPHMLLLVLHDAGLATLDAAAVQRWARRYYTWEEGGQPTDARFEALMERLGRHDPIPVVAVDELDRLEPLDRW